MNIKSYNIRPVGKKLFCKNCNVEMKFTGQVLMSLPAQYAHECPQCREFKYGNKQYPTIEFEWEE